MEKEQPKSFPTFKKLDVQAKIFGLNYTTFFIWVVLSAVTFMVASNKGLIGSLIGGLLVLGVYAGLYFFQTSYGPKKTAKMISDWMNPVHHIKMNVSFKKLYK